MMEDFIVDTVEENMTEEQQWREMFAVREDKFLEECEKVIIEQLYKVSNRETDRYVSMDINGNILSGGIGCEGWYDCYRSYNLCVRITGLYDSCKIDGWSLLKLEELKWSSVAGMLNIDDIDLFNTKKELEDKIMRFFCENILESKDKNLFDGVLGR